MGHFVPLFPAGAPHCPFVPMHFCIQQPRWDITRPSVPLGAWFSPTLCSSPLLCTVPSLDS